MPEENANPQGSENQPEPSIESAFDDYLKRQADPSGDAAEETQPEEAKPTEEATEEPEEQRYTVKINGEDKEVPLSELLKGYSLEADYRVKSSQVAEQRREAAAQLQQAAQERQQYAQALDTYQTQLAAMQPQFPSEELAKNDPAVAVKMMVAYQEWQGQMQQAQYERQQLSQRQQQEQERALSERSRTEYDALLSAIPEWKDDAKARSGKAELTAFLAKSGYAESEIAQATDHRTVLLARKAMLYDQMQAKQSLATNKVATLPPKSVQRPGSGEISPTDGRTRSMQALKKSGSIDDATNAFAALMGRK